MVPTALLVTLALASADPEPAEEQLTARTRSVRSTYSPVPPDILGVSEPVNLVSASVFFDSLDVGTIYVVFEDARGITFNVSIDGSGRGTFPEKFKDSEMMPGERNSIHTSSGLLLRGPEEAAIYGLLIRWSQGEATKAEAGTLLATSSIGWANRLLTAMDHRFGHAVNTD